MIIIRFLFQKIKHRFEVNDFVNDEVLALCEKLCDCKFESIKKMLSDNAFYGRIFSK